MPIPYSYAPSRNRQRAAPETISKPIEMIMEDAGTGHMHKLHQEHTEFDITFDILSGTMVLKQNYRDPETWPLVQFMTAVFFNQNNTTIVNLEGLADNSLLLTFKLNSTGSSTMKPNLKVEKTQLGPSGKLKVRYRDNAFATNNTPFFKTFADWDGEEKILQLFLPQNRIKSWKTVALILLTYREINTTIWHRLVNDGRLRDLAGFDWTRVREWVHGINPMDIRPKTNIPVRDQSALKAKTALEARLIAMQTGMGLKALVGGSADYRPFAVRICGSPGSGLRGSRIQRVKPRGTWDEPGL